MNHYHSKFDLEDFEQNKILLQMKKNEIFKSQYCYMKYNYVKEGCPSLDIYTVASSKTQAKEYITKDINLLSFLYNIDIFGVNSLYITEISDSYINEPTYINNNINNLNMVINSINSFPNKVKIDSSIKYFVRGLRLADLELYEESFLTFFKCLEIVCDEIYSKEYKKLFDEKVKSIYVEFIKDWYQEEYQSFGSDQSNFKDLKKLFNKLETKRRIILKSLNYLKIEDGAFGVGKLVKLRNSIGAHGNTSSNGISIYSLQEISNLAHLVIAKYLMRDDYEKAKMTGKKSYY